MKTLEQLGIIRKKDRLVINGVDLPRRNSSNATFIDALAAGGCTGGVVELHYAGDKLRAMYGVGSDEIGLTSFIKIHQLHGALVIVVINYTVTTVNSVNRGATLTLLTNCSVNTYVLTDVNGLLDVIGVDQVTRDALHIDLLEVDAPTLYRRLSTASWFPGKFDPLAVIVDQVGRRLAVYPRDNIAYNMFKLNPYITVDLVFELDGKAVDIELLADDVRLVASQLARDQLVTNANGIVDRDAYGVVVIDDAHYEAEFNDALVRRVNTIVLYYTLINGTWCLLRRGIAADNEIIETIRQREQALSLLTN